MIVSKKVIILVCLILVKAFSSGLIHFASNRPHKKGASGTKQPGAPIKILILLCKVCHGNSSNSFRNSLSFTNLKSTHYVCLHHVVNPSSPCTTPRSHLRIVSATSCKTPRAGFPAPMHRQPHHTAPQRDCTCLLSSCMNHRNGLVHAEELFPYFF